MARPKCWMLWNSDFPSKFATFNPTIMTKIFLSEGQNGYARWRYQWKVKLRNFVCRRKFVKIHEGGKTVDAVGYKCACALWSSCCGQNRGVQDIHCLHNLRSPPPQQKKLILGHLKKFKCITYYPVCKMKLSFDKETAYPLTYPFVTYLWFTLLELPIRMFAIIKPQVGSTNQCSLLLSHNTHLWPYYYRVFQVTSLGTRKKKLLLRGLSQKSCLLFF